MSAALDSWIDGVRGETLPADDRGLHYGDGLFESIGVRAGVARFLEAHLARLASGCARLGNSLQLDGGVACRDRGGVGAGATSGNAQDHRHAWQCQCAGVMRPRAPNRRDA